MPLSSSRKKIRAADELARHVLERTTGFEPATPGLGSQCSTN
jgi:hypothetical protein